MRLEIIEASVIVDLDDLTYIKKWEKEFDSEIIQIAGKEKGFEKRIDVFFKSGKAIFFELPTEELRDKYYFKIRDYMIYNIDPNKDEV